MPWYWSAGPPWPAERVKRLCEHLNPWRGQTQLAKKIGVSDRTVRTWIKGDRSPGPWNRLELDRVARQTGFIDVERREENRRLADEYERAAGGKTQ